MNLKTFLFMGCIFAACSRPPAHVKTTDEVTRCFCEKMLKENALISLGAGGFFENKRVNAFYADYEMFVPYDKSEARKLLSRVTSEFIDYINQDEMIRPHLKTYPITANEVSVSIAFFDPHRKPQELAQIHLYQGRVYYSTYNQDKKAYLAFDNEGY